MSALSRFVSGVKQLLTPVDERSRGGTGGWTPFFSNLIREPFAGAWQQNQQWTASTVVQNPAVFACVTRIAQDISKLRLKLEELTPDGIWVETTSPSFSPVLKKPNGFQNHIKFKESWLISLLMRGNTYVLKRRDLRQVVTDLYILDPNRVTPLVTPLGDVYYRLNNDNLSGITETITIPASEIIHDRINCLFHPLVGHSPIFAAGCAADEGLEIQKSSTAFFANALQPGGLIMAPGEISQKNADEIKKNWNERFTGVNGGKLAVLEGGLTYETLRMSSVDAQLIEQLKWTSEIVCSCFHVPAYKVGFGPIPTHITIEALDTQYYSECLQIYIESMEACLDEGLSLDGTGYGTALDLNGLLRMDTASKTTAVAEAVKAGFMSPNEARAMFDLVPVDGGATPYLQQQNYSLEALSKRDSGADPFATNTPTPAVPAVPAPDAAATKAANDDFASLMALMTKDFA